MTRILRQGDGPALENAPLSRDLLAGHRRMRASLAGILPLDPPGISLRLEEMDREIAHLSALLESGVSGDEPAPAKSKPDFVPIGAAVKAA